MANEILSKEELVLLNNYMLGLGQPTERDNVGYNKPDWSVMNNLAYIPAGDLSDLHAGVLVSTLRKYTNTQLKSKKDIIQATVKHYDDTLLNSFNRNYIDYTSFGKTDFLKGANAKYIPMDKQKPKHYNIISVVSVSEKGLLLDFEDVRKAHTFKNETDGVFYTQKMGKWNLFVPYEKLKDFIDIMATAKKQGIDGYEPDDKLKQILVDVDKFKAYIIETATKQREENDKKAKEELSEAEKKDRAMRTVRIEKIDKSKEEVMVYYDKFIREMVDFKNANRDKVGLRNDARTNKWYTVIKFDFIDEWKKKAEENGLLLCDELKNFNTKQFEEEKQAKHKNDNTLIDLDKLNLPFTPYDFQIQDATRLLSRDKMLIGHDMGCGKTFISGLVGNSIEGRKLVICPETLRKNWQKEMKSLGKEANILYSKDAFWVSDNPNSFTIVGYQTAHKFKDELLKENFNIVFVDEVHNCKAVDNKGLPSSNRAESVMELVGNAKYGYLLSGTPIPTRNKDLFNILKMLDIEEINFENKWAFFNYGKEFCDGQNNGYGWDFSGNSNSDDLHKLLEPYMVRRTKKEVLPNLTKQRLFIPLEIDNKEYRQIEKKLYNMDDNETYMGLAMTGRRILSGSKVKSAIEFADGLLNEDKSVVIVSNFNETLDSIKEKYGDNACVIRGGMTDNAKQKAIEDFQSGKCKVCALNIIAGGVGITLTKAHDMIVCDYDWTPANMIQVEDRICRVGQTEHCNIHYLYGDDCLIDEIFVDMITNKNANIDKVVDNADNGMDLVADKNDNSDNYINILKNRVEGEKARTFDEKGLIDKIPTEINGYTLLIKKSDNFLEKKQGYPMYEILLCKGDTTESLVLKQSDIVKEMASRDSTTVKHLTKKLSEYTEKLEEREKPEGLEDR